MQIEQKVATSSAMYIEQLAGFDDLFRITGMLLWGLVAFLGVITLIWLMIKILRFTRSHKIVAKS